MTSRHFLPVLFVIACLLTASLIGEPVVSAAEKALMIGDAPPRVTLPDLKGSLTTIPDDLKGKVVIIRFWADWCSSCAEEMPALESLYKELKGKGLFIVAVNVGQTKEKVEAFVNKKKITYSVLLDQDTKTARKYGVVGLPKTFILDKKGLIKYKLLGDASQETVRKLVLKII